jgi:GNAT superfamily N-acetyltransferase
MMREYYAYDHLLFRPEVARPAIARMVDDPSLGSLWLIRRGEDVLGYMVLAFSFSLEFGGRIAILDEFFLRAHQRRRGIGKHALTFLEGVCRPLGVKAIRLEVEKKNEHARVLYEKAGFVAHDRLLMSRVLPRH